MRMCYEMHTGWGVAPRCSSPVQPPSLTSDILHHRGTVTGSCQTASEYQEHHLHWNYGADYSCKYGGYFLAPVRLPYKGSFIAASRIIDQPSAKVMLKTKILIRITFDFTNYWHALCVPCGAPVIELLWPFYTLQVSPLSCRLMQLRTKEDEDNFVSEIHVVPVVFNISFSVFVESNFKNIVATTAAQPLASLVTTHVSKTSETRMNVQDACSKVTSLRQVILSLHLPWLLRGTRCHFFVLRTSVCSCQQTDTNMIGTTLQVLRTGCPLC